MRWSCSRETCQIRFTQCIEICVFKVVLFHGARPPSWVAVNSRLRGSRRPENPRFRHRHLVGSTCEGSDAANAVSAGLQWICWERRMDDETGGVPSSQVGAALSVHFVRPHGIQGACSYLGDGIWSMKQRNLTEHSRVTARELRFCTILWF